MNPKEFGQYLAELRRKAGFRSQTALAKASGVWNSTISRIEGGQTERPGPKTLAILAPFLGVAKEELFRAAGYMDEESRPVQLEVASKIPILGTIRAGKPIYAQECIEGWEEVPYELVQGGSFFFLKVSGDSMIESGIKEGHLVLIREQPEVENGEIAAVMVGQDEATLKRVYIVWGNPPCGFDSRPRHHLAGNI